MGRDNKGPVTEADKQKRILAERAKAKEDAAAAKAAADALAKQKEQEARNLLVNERAKREANQARITAEYITMMRNQWAPMIRAIVVQVRTTRDNNDGRNGINAGYNENVILPDGTRGDVTTAGGTDTAIVLVLDNPNPTNVTKRQVLDTFADVDGSDSADMKLRVKDGARKDILIHYR